MLSSSSPSQKSVCEKIPLVMFIQYVKHGIGKTHIFLGFCPKQSWQQKKSV